MKFLFFIVVFPRLVVLRDTDLLKKKESFVIDNYFIHHTRSPEEQSTTEKKFIFEGVDYDTIDPKNKDVWDVNHDCYHYFLDCIRDQTFLHPVCAFNGRTVYFENFYSFCEIELNNCIWRETKRLPFKGNNMRDNNILYYNGDDFACVIYYRRGNMVKAYFGDDFDYKAAGIDHYVYENVTYYI